MIVHTKVDFSKKVLDWDGFGFNYVETAQTVDYSKNPQDYGGFSILSTDNREKIMQLVFGTDGLKPCAIKMFLDPFHQTASHVNRPGYGNIDMTNYSHEHTTTWMRLFTKRGLEITHQDHRDIKIITTLYGPPAFMTKQKFLRGRDLDPEYREELAKYMVAWVKYLHNQGILVSYISIHNEGEDYFRWPEDGNDGNIGTGHDYNLYWSPESVADFMKLLRDVLDANGMFDVYPTPGETSNWTRFYNWGYADAISDNPEAVNSIGLITSHGFSGGSIGDRWYGDHRSVGVDEIRKHRPELHSWVTSTSWAQMDAKFIQQIYGNIYSAKCNCIIPWAGVQRPTLWIGGDPNPGNAIQVNEDGTFTIHDGYYYYKQVCPVGQAGMYVAKTYSTSTETCAIAFASGETQNPNAFVLVNSADEEVRFQLRVDGTKSSLFSVYITSSKDKCKTLPDVWLKDGSLEITLAENSVATFVEK